MRLYSLKMLLLGDEELEKTRLIKEYANAGFNINYKVSLGCNIFTIHGIVNEGYDYITMSVWDVAEGKRFKSFRSSFFQGASGAMIVLDTTDYSTFKRDALNWMNELNKSAGKIPLILFGTNLKSFSSRTVSLVDAVKIVKLINETMPCMYFENKDKNSIKNALNTLMSEMFHKGKTKLLSRSQYQNLRKLQELKFKKILQELGVSIIGNEAIIFKRNYYFRINLNNGQVFVHSLENERKFARICLQAEQDGWTNVNLNSFKLGMLAKIASIVWDDLPHLIYPQIDQFVLDGVGGPNLFPNF